MRGVSSMAGSKIACGPTRPLSGSMYEALVASIIRAATGSAQSSRHIVPRGSDDVVAGLELKPPEIAEQLAAPAMHEQQLVAVGIAREVVHGAARRARSGCGNARCAAASAADQGLAATASSLVRSKACGRSGPSKDDQPVGGWRWWKNAAGPKNPSLLISRS